MLISRLAATAAAFAITGAAMAQPAAPAPAAAPPPAAAAPAAPSMTITPAGDIIATLQASGQFTILLKALDAANLTSFLKGAGPYTLLAPTDAAFNALPAGELASLMKTANAAQLQAVLAYHLINAGVPEAKLQGSKGPIPSATGPQLMIDGTTTPIHINDAAVLGEAQVSNGYIYAIDKVLTPPAAAPAAPAPAPKAAPAT